MSKAGEPVIWMNVTTSARWSRPPVGIVRVERAVEAELARLYGKRFQRCVWSGDRFVACEGIRKEANDGNDPPATISSAKKRSLPWMFPVLTRREGLHALGQAVLSLAPTPIRPFVNRMLYRFRWRFGSLMNHSTFFRLRQHFARQEGREKFSAIAAKQGGAFYEVTQSSQIFERGDVLVSIGLDWDSPYYKQFYALRRDLGVRVVTCCYDLIPVLFPQYCVGDVAALFTSYFLDLADGSDLVLCISKQSQSDFRALMHRTGGALPRTHVFPLGDNVMAGAAAEAVSDSVKALCGAQYLLFVSTIERRKNHEVLYRAYHILASQGKGARLPKLVFVGMQGWGVGDLMKDIELDPLTQGLIVHLNHVNDSELKVLYQHALGCLFPSLYEGWGLPVGEALAMGKVVLCSDRGSLPEVGGDLVQYIDPWQPGAWADAIWRLVTDGAWRIQTELRIQGLYVPRTWHAAGTSISAAIDAMLEPPCPN